VEALSQEGTSLDQATEEGKSLDNAKPVQLSSETGIISSGRGGSGGRGGIGGVIGGGSG